MVEKQVAMASLTGGKEDLGLVVSESGGGGSQLAICTTERGWRGPWEEGAGGGAEVRLLLAGTREVVAELSSQLPAVGR